MSAHDQNGPHASPQTAVARRAVAADLAALLSLYRELNPSMPTLSEARAAAIWAETMAQPGTVILVAEADRGLAATCMLVTAPNLMRGGKPHAFLENVVTSAAVRGQGHGRAVIMAAFETAWDLGCHQVLLQSGRPEPGVHRFYEKCGFVPGLRTAYAITRPEGR